MSITGFLLDENLTPNIQVQLMARDPTIHVLTIGQPGALPKGTLDPDVLCWIEAHNYVLVTANRASMPGHLGEHLKAGRHIPGILILPRHWALGQVLDALQLVWGASLPGEYQDQITYLTL